MNKPAAVSIVIFLVLVVVLAWIVLGTFFSDPTPPLSPGTSIISVDSLHDAATSSLETPSSREGNFTPSDFRGPTEGPGVVGPSAPPPRYGE